MGVLALSRAMGDHALKDMVLGEPFVQESNVDFQKAQKAFVILACDGLWDVMSDREAVNIVAFWEGDPDEVAQALVDEGLRRGTTDNLTVVVAWLHNSA